jgi:hypothetical protein
VPSSEASTLNVRTSISSRRDSRGSRDTACTTWSYSSTAHAAFSAAPIFHGQTSTNISGIKISISNDGGNSSSN